jgi:ubiquinone biosynthesis protein
LEVLSLAQKHRIRLPRDLILFFRAVVTLEHVGRSLDPDFRFSDFGQTFSKEILRRQFSAQNISRDLLRGLEGLRLLPGVIRTLAHKLETDELFPSQDGLEKGFLSLKRSNQLLASILLFTGFLMSSVFVSAMIPGHFAEPVLWALAGLSALIALFRLIRS